MNRDPVDYDRVAGVYDRRYVEHRYPGIHAVLREFATSGHSVLEVGCGTGYWLETLDSLGCRGVGLDPSHEMLCRARQRFDGARLVRGRAEILPFDRDSFDRIAVVNALHHFDEPSAFVREAQRTLRPGGKIVILGLDPKQGLDDWFVYDWFPRTLTLDRQRYPGTGQILDWLEGAGFVRCRSCVGHRIRLEESARDYLARDGLTRESTSQLGLLNDREFEDGLQRLRRAVRAGAERGEELTLRANLRIYATFGSVASGQPESSSSRRCSSVSESG